MLSTRSCLAATLLVSVVLAVILIVTTTAWGVGIDVTTSMDQGSAKNTVSASSFSTSSGNELLLAFISADSTASPNATVTQVAGGGLTWVLVERANAQLGTAEIWRTFAPSALSSVTGGVHFPRQRGSHWSIQGIVSPSSSGTGATVTLTQGSTTVATTTVGAAGSYSFSGVVNGTYTVAPSNAGYVFAPSSQSVTVNGASITGVNFTASLPTGSIQGNISPSSSSTGATVTLTQGSTTIAATTVDSNGNYSLNGVVNGTYSVTPTKSGYACTPLSQNVTVNGAPVTSINFTASALPTYSISGMISPSANGSGAIVTLSGTASATTTADTSGAFSFSGLANGSYTVTATNAGFAISPASQPVSVNNAPVTGVNFTAAVGLAIDVVTYGDSNSPSTTAVTSTFSTAASNELLLAFISADSTASPNTTVTQVAGGGLTWVLVERVNVQLGTAEIWRAFAPSALSGVTVTATLSQKVDSSITVMSFSGVSTSGTNGSGAIGAVGSGNADPGAPTATLVTTANGSLVLGVGNDWDNAIARTLGPNQTMVHQLLANVGDTYWVQRESNATSLSGTSVTLNDSAPTSDRYNLTIVEVLPAPAGTVSTYGIFGTLSPSTQGSGATVTLRGTASGTTTADGSGNYGFSGLSSGSYTVTPSKSGYSFSPAAQSATINGANVANLNFTVSSSPPPVAVSISPTSATLSTGGQQQFTAYVSGTSNTAVTWSATGGTVTTSGLYTAPGTAGTYTVTATSAADTTKSASASVTVSQASQVSVSVSPTAVSMNQGAQQQFTATVVGTSNTGVNWSLISGSGTVSSSGLFTAPNKQESDTVQAQSQADTTKTATATVTVPAVGITLSPLSATVQPSGTQQFTATVTGTTNTGVSWSEVGGGSVTQAGLYTAPATSETDTVTATVMASSAATKSASVTVANQSQSGCGATLNWTNSVCQQINGTLKPQWTVVSRHGEYAQGESECNVPWEVFAGNGELRIQTEAVPGTCGDFNVDGTVRATPASWAYTTGDVQMNTFSFTHGSVVVRAAFPSQRTHLWPTYWMLGSNCQNSNKYSGDTGFGGCPNLGASQYQEIDGVECDMNGWCLFNVANPNWVCGTTYSVDTNVHTFMTIWSANNVSQYVDGNQVGSCNATLPNAMFLLMQIQTGGAGGAPNNSLLPASMTVNYVQICNTTDGSCPNVPSTDPSVIFYDNFGAN